jgi:hypothetical protein
MKNISGMDSMKSKKVLHKVKEEKNVLHAIIRKKAN